MPRLVIRKGDGIGKDLALSAECVVGRHPGSQFVVEDLLVSRRHFRVFSAEGGWWVEDLGSRNGTLVNGQRTAGKRALSDGDVIAAGNTEMVFVQKDLLAGAAPAKPPVAAAAPPPPPPSSAPAPTPGGQAPVPRRRRDR
jgi:predicted component of type VI protein secretion system